MLDKVHLKPADQLFFLGDYVNKGPRSCDTLDYIINLSSNNLNIHCLLGNHDLIILNHLTGTITQSHERLHSWNSECFYHTGEREHYINFLNNLPYFIEMEDCFLVHAGFDFSAPQPFEAWEAMLNIVGIDVDNKLVMGKKIIHGHFPQTLDTIKSAIDKNSQVIGLDNGCVYQGIRKEQGCLLCLDLTGNKLYQQQKVD